MMFREERSLNKRDLTYFKHARRDKCPPHSVIKIRVVSDGLWFNALLERAREQATA